MIYRLRTGSGYAAVGAGVVRQGVRIDCEVCGYGDVVGYVILPFLFFTVIFALAIAFVPI